MMKPRLTFSGAGFASLALMLMGATASAQTITAKAEAQSMQQPAVVVEAPGAELTVRGVVKDEANEVMAGVNIILKGSPYGTMTDADGRFEFPRKLNPGDVLLFSFIGHHTREYVVPDTAGTVVEINIVMDAVITLGEVAVDGVYDQKQSSVRKLLRKARNGR